MRSPHHPHAGRHRARTHIVDAEQLKRRARADDVDDRVNASHLMEVHLLGRAAVHAALDLGEGTERRE